MDGWAPSGSVPEGHSGAGVGKQSHLFQRSPFVFSPRLDSSLSLFPALSCSLLLSYFHEEGPSSGRPHAPSARAEEDCSIIIILIILGPSVATDLIARPRVATRCSCLWTAAGTPALHANGDGHTHAHTHTHTHQPALTLPTHHPPVSCTTRAGEERVSHRLKRADVFLPSTFINTWPSLMFSAKEQTCI